MQDSRYWERFPILTEKVRQDHIVHGVHGGSHDFYHALAVAQYALLIVEDTALASLAWVAGLCHNTDKMFPAEKVSAVVQDYLDTGTDFSLDEKTLVRVAVLEHGKRNDPCDSLVTVALKDGDRLGNIGPLHWLRSAQFRPSILPVDPRYISSQDPTATFKNPKTILRDIEHTLEWEEWLRLPKAKQLGKPLFAEIRRFKATIQKQFETLGLLPFPSELVVEPEAERSVA